MRQASEGRHVPAWVDGVAAVTWVTSTDHRLLALNARAERLLGTTAEQCEGCPCHEVVASRGPNCGPFCGPDCIVARRARDGREILPFRVLLPSRDGDMVPACVLAVPERSPLDGAAVIVHCALLEDRAGRVEHRFCPIETLVRCPAGSRLDCLSPREQDVLRSLIADGSLAAVSDRLSIARTTVRNHIQHILTKLEVHSMRDAIVRVMAEGGPERIDIEAGRKDDSA